MHDGDGWLHQDGFSLRLEWGHRGAYEAGRRGDVVIVVDVLSFSTAVLTAVERGTAIIPYPYGDEAAAQAEAARLGAAITPSGFPDGARRALSPVRFAETEKRDLELLRSPNGATCVRLAADGGVVLAGCLRNPSAVAAAAKAIAAEEARTITVVPCGERWPPADGAPTDGLRPCLEDLLGAGAIVKALALRGSPEAEMAERVFSGLRGQLRAALMECISGRELVERGYADDVHYAAMLDCSPTAPRLHGDRFQP